MLNTDEVTASSKAEGWHQHMAFLGACAKAHQDMLCDDQIEIKMLSRNSGRPRIRSGYEVLRGVAYHWPFKITSCGFCLKRVR